MSLNTFHPLLRARFEQTFSAHKTTLIFVNTRRLAERLGVAHITSNRILFQDGLPVAIWEGKKTQYLKELPVDQQWSAHKVLVRRKSPAKLRYYLGKNYA